MPELSRSFVKGLIFYINANLILKWEWKIFLMGLKKVAGYLSWKEIYFWYEHFQCNNWINYGGWNLVLQVKFKFDLYASWLIKRKLICHLHILVYRKWRYLLFNSQVRERIHMNLIGFWNLNICSCTGWK